MTKTPKRRPTLKRNAVMAALLAAALGFGRAPLWGQEAPPVKTEEKEKSAKTGKDVKDEGQNIDELKKDAPKVFLDGERLDLNYIKTEIEFVNYVRDRKEADVHVLITQLSTGSGGQEYTLAFIGLGTFEDLKNKLKYYTNRINTSDENRKGLVQMLKLGLAPYIARTPIAQVLNLNFAGRVKPTSVVDKWNFWVFSLSANTRLNGEKSRKSNSLFGNVSVNRTTPQAKLRLGVSANEDETRYDYEDYQGTSASRSRSFDGLYVYSLGEHWSVGGYVNVNHSTYGNVKFGITFAPAIEYNFFPYSESTRRQFRLLYRLGYNLDKYIEETVYSRTEDKTWSQSLTATLEFKQPWGDAELSVEGSNFFVGSKEDAPSGTKFAPPWKFYRFRVSGNFSIRIIKGFSVTVDGRYSRIHDQLALRGGEADLTELLLRRTELASNYSYQLRVGLNFSFGSVYSNVVNPRFGSGYGGMSGMGMGGGGWDR
jgi:hypothetical protein